MLRILTVIALAASTTNALAAPKYASKAEFYAAIVGRNISSKTSKGLLFTAVIKSDGTGTFTIKGQPADPFKWTLEDAVFCWEFKKFTECSKVEIVSPKAANFYDAKSGKLNNAYQVK